MTYPRMRLADLAADVSYGYTASATQDPVGPRFLRITDIVPKRLEWEKVPFCAISDRDYAKHRLAPGDIVIARTGSVGYSKYLPDPPDAVYASYLVRIRIAADYDSQYVGYVVSSSDYREFVLANAGGVAQPNANAKVLTSYSVPVPPFTIQQKIAAVLSAYDDLIENNILRIKLLEEMAQRIYLESFVEFRYPGHETVPLIESDLGPIPDGWHVKSIGDVVETLGGGTPPKQTSKYWEEGSVDWFTPTDLTRAEAMFMHRSATRITELGIAKSSAKLFPVGAVMMTSRATIGVVSITKVVATTNQGFITCVPNDRLCSYHLYFWLRGHVDVISSLASGATFKEINKSTFRAIPIVVPTPAVEASFLSTVESLCELVDKLLIANQVLRTSRDILLPRLISGEIDVEDLDIETAKLAA